MQEEAVETHQLGGTDDRDRGFNRPVLIRCEGARYRATLRYEALALSGEWSEDRGEALLDLIRTLHARGYRQLKSQLSFRGAQYLGNQEAWIEYPDPSGPETAAPGIVGLWHRITQVLGRSGRQPR